MRGDLEERMAATYNVLLVGLAGMAIGWILALRALTELGPWGPLAGLAFLGLVIVGLIRAADI
ncbi:MAG: hypothetical protein QN157_01210 [Armatimonadota bacterium]|nr:hypothetical protein [Armatimonadota bacterium]